MSRIAGKYLAALTPLFKNRGETTLFVGGHYEVHNPGNGQMETKLLCCKYNLDGVDVANMNQRESRYVQRTWPLKRVLDTSAQGAF